MKYQKASVAAHSQPDQLPGSTQCDDWTARRIMPECADQQKANELHFSSHWPLALPAPSDETGHALFWNERDFNFLILD